jgi:hypothetical protein
MPEALNPKPYNPHPAHAPQAQPAHAAQESIIERHEHWYGGEVV